MTRSAVTPTEAVDVAVIGAGPAGSVTAILLAAARPELRIALWEAAPRPQQRPCGEFLSPDGLRVLDAAGLLERVLGTGCVALDGLRLAAPAGRLDAAYRPWLGQHPFRDHGLGLRRERFDAELQDAAAGIGDLQRGIRLRSMALDPDGRGWLLRGGGTGPRSLLARIVVGADGRHSAVRRLAGLDRGDPRPRYALTCRARGIPHGRRGEMHLGPLGQLGLAPLGEGEVNLNLLLAERSAGLLKRRSPEHLMRAALRATPSLRGRSAGALLGRVQTTGRLPQRSTSASGERVALVGDAAGFCDPFTGEGICFALQGAEMLAATLARIPARGTIEPGILESYASEWRRRFGPKLRMGAGLQHILARRGLAEHLVAWLGRFEGCNRLFIALTGDYAHLIPRRRHAWTASSPPRT